MFSQKSKIYVAGHEGLIGSAIMRRLKADGYRNIVTRGRGELDLSDSPRVDAFFMAEKPEFVFLAAGRSGGIVANIAYPSSFIHENISIQDNVFEAAERNGVTRLVFYGSSCMYPISSPQPISEEYLMTGPIEKTSEPYAIAKIAGVVACRAYNNQYKSKRFIALVPNSVYGQNDNFSLESSHVMAGLIRRFHEAKTEGVRRIHLWGTGNPRREFMHADDAASASVFAMLNHDKLDNTHYNIGTGEDSSIAELACMIAGTVGYNGEVAWNTARPDGAMRKILDSSRFSSLGWRPQVTLHDGIKSTYEWFLASEYARALI
ncbi:MAG: GDP-fucose synthetase [Deltaproteobacteria bacterium GWB2_55_19]|nr:MAG: GDP-fucose synthetase [Deltaproteobacteria bacterium GWB2_55_19]HAO92855.1 GDP-fucose synthetase [Deltaproteobacteria bacterium]